ncbi:head decoration protein, partial [Acinetobacter baumannii]
FLPGKRPVFMNYTLKGGQQLVAGSVLGRITASGLLVLSNAAAGDGSQVPMAILCEDVMTFAPDGVTARDTPLSVAVQGYFNRTALNFDPS